MQNAKHLMVKNVVMNTEMKEHKKCKKMMYIKRKYKCYKLNAK